MDTRSTFARTPLALLLLLALPVMFLAVACGDDDDDNETPTAAATTAAASGTAATTASATSTTPAATGTATGAASPTGTAAQGEGTPAPGGGQTTPYQVTPSPATFQGNVTLRDVRTGRHDVADRIVFEFDGSNLPPAEMKYVDSVSQCGSGEQVAIDSEAILEVRIERAQAHTDAGQATVDAEVPGPGQTINTAVRTCDFEGVVTYAVGVTGEQNFKVLTLQNPTRLVVDVLK